MLGLTIANIPLARGETAPELKLGEARWIWATVELEKPFQFVRFRKTFELKGRPESVRVLVTGDTFYRLWINGQLVMHGPARSVAGKATLDPLDVTPYLKAGKNTILADAFYGVCLFEALAQAPGFLCQLEWKEDGQDRVMATDGSWEARELKSWSRKSPRFSFQRGWVEDVDGRLEEESGWKPAKVLGAVGTPPWKIVELRDIPLPAPLLEVKPAKVIQVQRGDGFTTGVARFWFEEEKSPAPEWVRRLETEHVRPDEKAAKNPRGMIDGGKGETILNGEGATVVYDMGQNTVGFVGFDVSGRAGDVLEVTWQERLSDRGQTVRLRERLTSNLALRYTLREGRQSFLGFTPQVVRYLRVTYRGQGKIQLHGLSVTQFHFGAPVRGSFACSDDGLNRIYAAAQRTALLNTVDTFMDCPSRERGAWLHDGTWTAQAVYAMFGDLSVNRRMVADAAASQDAPGRAGPAGMVQMLYPSHVSGSYIPGHAMFWVLQAGLDERFTGDTAFIKTQLPAIRRLMTAFDTMCTTEGLMDAKGSWNFIDWAEIKADGMNVGINAIYAVTLDEAARLEGLAGDAAHQAEYADKAKQVREALRAACKGELYYPDTLTRGAKGELVPSREACETTQYYAMWAGIPSPERTERIWRAMRDKFIPTPEHKVQPIDGLMRGGSYSFIERLIMARRLGDEAALVRDLRAMYLPMADTPPGTMWENPWAADSLCHGFNSVAAVFLTEDVLGIQLGLPIRITPHSGGAITWSKGHITTPRGKIEVDWKAKAQSYELKVAIPKGSSAEVTLPQEAKAVWSQAAAKEPWRERVMIQGDATLRVVPGKITVKP